jgi:predicted RND superfamily exporter protein
VCFVAVLLVTAGLAQHLPALRVDPRIDKTFPGDDPRLADYQALRATFGAGEDTALCVVEFPGDVLERETMARIHTLTEQLEQEPWLDAEQLLSLSRATFVRVDGEGELDIGPLYTPARHSTWDPAEIDQALRNHPAFDQRLVSRDRRLAGFWIPQAPGDDSDAARARFVAGVRGFFSPQGALRADEVPYLEGFALANDSILQMILRDSWSLFPLAFCVLLVVLAALFRQVVAPLLALTVIAFSCAWTLGAMAWASVPLSTLAACIPVMVLVASVGDVVHLLTRFQTQLRAGLAQEAALVEAVHHMAGPCLLTSLTTAAGFACLGLSQVELLSEFGLPVAGGVLAAYVVTLGAVPTLLTYLPTPTARARAAARPRGFTEGIVRLATGRPLTVVAGTLLLAGAALLAAPALSLDARMSDDLDASSELYRSRELLSSRFGGASTLEVVLDTGEAGRALSSEVQQGVLALTQRLRGEDYAQLGVMSAFSLADFLRDAFHTWNGRAPEFDRLPDDDEALAQLHFLYLFCPQDPTADLVDSQADPSQTRVELRVGNVTTGEFFALAERIEADAAALLPADVGVTISGSSYMARLVTQSLVSEMLQSAGTAIVIVGLMVWFFFRSARLALLGVICSALPMLLVLGVMAVTGVTLTLSTSIVFALAFGISVDDTVHMLSCYSQRKAQGDPQALTNAVRATSRALVLSTLALVLGFSVLLASSFPANRSFAWLLSVTLVFALVADLLFLPAILRLCGEGATATRRQTLVRLTWPAARPVRLGGAGFTPALLTRARPLRAREGVNPSPTGPVRCRSGPGPPSRWRSGRAGRWPPPAGASPG